MLFHGATPHLETSGGACHARADPAPLSHLALCRKGAPDAGVQAAVLALGNDPSGHAQARPDRAHRRLSTHAGVARSEEHTSELQSLMRNSYAVFCLKKKKNK